MSTKCFVVTCWICIEQEMLYVSTIEAKMHPVISPTNPEVSIVEKPRWTIIYKRSINIIALSLANVSIISISSFDANLQALKLKKYENNLLK